MKLIELIKITDDIFYSNTNSYRVIKSKQKELLTIIKPMTNINKINRAMINKYIEYLKNNNNSNATINSKLAYLNHILNYAYKNGDIEHKPYIPTFKILTKKTKYLSDKEKNIIIGWCDLNKEYELQTIIIIGLNTGLRINNILSLTPENFEDNYLRVWFNKTNKPYSIPLNDIMQGIAKDFKPFTMNYQQVYYTFNRMKKETKIDDSITIHTLRHTFCSDLIQKGVELPIIQQLANHKKIQTTLRYAHLNNKQLENAVKLL